MDQDRAPIVPHNDGMFEFQKELIFEQKSVVEFAKEVISAYRVKEREKIAKLKRPITRIIGLPLKITMEIMRQRAGEISFAPTALYQFGTREEHANAHRLEAFFMHAEPDYPDLEAASKHHGDYCWKVALLNAFRILDLMEDTSIPFPAGWVPVNAAPEDRNFAGLLGSAAFQMGLYFAKAQAMPKAAAAIRGRKMAEAKKGHHSPLGEIIYSACSAIESRGESLSQKNVAGRVMAILEEQGRGSTQKGLYTIFVKEEEVTVTANKLGKFIRRYRERGQ